MHISMFFACFWGVATKHQKWRRGASPPPFFSFFGRSKAVSLNTKNGAEGHRALCRFCSTSKAVSRCIKNEADGHRAFFFVILWRIQKRCHVASERHRALVKRRDARAGERRQLVEQVRHRAVQALEGERARRGTGARPRALGLGQSHGVPEGAACCWTAPARGSRTARRRGCSGLPDVLLPERKVLRLSGVVHVVGGPDVLHGRPCCLRGRKSVFSSTSPCCPVRARRSRPGRPSDVERLDGQRAQVERGAAQAVETAAVAAEEALAPTAARLLERWLAGAAATAGQTHVLSRPGAASGRPARCQSRLRRRRRHHQQRHPRRHHQPAPAEPAAARPAHAGEAVDRLTAGASVLV